MAKNMAGGAIVGGLIGLLTLLMSVKSVENPQPHTPLYTTPDWALNLNKEIAENPLLTIVFPAVAGAVVVFAVSKGR